MRWIYMMRRMSHGRSRDFSERNGSRSFSGCADSGSGRAGNGKTEIMRKRTRARVKNKLLHAYFIFGKDVNIVARKKTKRLRYEDRVIIERMSKAGKKVADIANEIGVHRDTIYKEFTRCGATKETYSAEKAQREI